MRYIDAVTGWNILCFDSAVIEKNGRADGMPALPGLGWELFFCCSGRLKDLRLRFGFPCCQAEDLLEVGLR